MCLFSPHRSPPQFEPSLLLINSILLENLQINLLQRTLIRSLKPDLGDNLLPFTTSSLIRLQPPTSTKTPLATTFQPNRSQIIPSLGREIEEFIRHRGGDRVVPEVGGWDVAVPVSEEAGHWACAVEGEGGAEDVEGF